MTMSPVWLQSKHILTVAIHVSLTRRLEMTTTKVANRSMTDGKGQGERCLYICDRVGSNQTPWNHEFILFGYFLLWNHERELSLHHQESILNRFGIGDSQSTPNHMFFVSTQC